MAETIKGINVVIGAETTGLSAALSDVNKKSRDIQGELKQVEKLLKLDPANTELLAQKQKLLGDAVNNTKEKLDRLKTAQEQVNKQFQDGQISEGQYRAFQREVAKTEQELRSLDSRLKDTGPAFKQLGDEAESAASKIKNAGEGVQNAGEKMSLGITAPLAGIVALATEGTEETRKFMSRLETNAQTAGVSLDLVNEKMRDLNALTGETDSNVEALSNILASGFKGDQFQQVVDALSGAAIKFSDTLKIEGLADGLQETLATGAAIGPFAELLDRSGISLDNFNAGLAEANKNGKQHQYVLDVLTKAGLVEINKAYRENNKALVENANAQYDLQQSLAELGKTLQPILTIISGKVAEMLKWFNDLDSGTQKVILTIAGIAAAIGPALIIIGQLITVIGTISTAFSAASAAIAAAGGVMAVLTGPIGVAVAAIAGLIAASVLIYKNWDEIKAFLISTWATISKTASTVWEGIKTFFVNMWGGIATTTKNIWDGIVSFFQEAWDTIMGIFEAFWDETGPMIEAGWGNLVQIFGAYFKTVGEVVEAAWEIIKTTFATFLLAIYYIVTGQWDKIGDVFNKAWQKIKSIVTSLWENIKQIWSNAFNVVATNTSTIWNKISSLFTGAWNNLKSIVSKLWESIKNTFVDTGAFVTKTVSAMWGSIVSFYKQAPGKIIDALSSLPTKVMDIWQDLKSGALDMGENIVKGLIEGIWNMASWAKKQIKEFFGNIEDWAKDILGIHSPSRVFKKLGGYTTEGFALGMEDNLRMVSQAANALATSALPSIPATGGGGSPIQVLVTGNTISRPADEDRLAEKISRKLAGQFGLSVGGAF